MHTRYIKLLLSFVFIVWAFASPVNAQFNKTQAQNKAQAQELDVDDVYPKDRRGCGMRAATFVAVLQKYKDGDAANDLTNMKMIEPLIDGIYKTIRKKGVEEALLDNMKDYRKCLRQAKPHKNEKREAEMFLKRRACGQMNDVILDTLASIKRRQKLETVLSRYENKKLDMTWTSYEKIPDPAIYFASSLYDEAAKGSYGDAVELGSFMSLGCFI